MTVVGPLSAFFNLEQYSCHARLPARERRKSSLDNQSKVAFQGRYTPNANMADHSVGARDESHESEVSQALMFCFDNAFPEKPCFVVDLVPSFCPLYPFLCS